MAYSENVLRALICAWIVAAAVLAWRSRRGAGAFRGSAVAAIPAMGYSMLGYGLLPMAGVLHLLSAGLLGLVAYGIRTRLLPLNRAGLTSRSTAFETADEPFGET